MPWVFDELVVIDQPRELHRLDLAEKRPRVHVRRFEIGCPTRRVIARLRSADKQVALRRSPTRCDNQRRVQVLADNLQRGCQDLQPLFKQRPHLVLAKPQVVIRVDELRKPKIGCQFLFEHGLSPVEGMCLPTGMVSPSSGGPLSRGWCGPQRSEDTAPLQWWGCNPPQLCIIAPEGRVLVYLCTSDTIPVWWWET